MARVREDRGQATVEAALILPFLAAFIVLLIQVGVVVRGQIMVIHAARQAARVVAVDPAADAHAAALDAAALDPSNTTVIVGGSTEPGGLVTVEVVLSIQPSVPLFGGSASEIDVTGSATMLVEGFPDQAAG